MSGKDDPNDLSAVPEIVEMVSRYVVTDGHRCDDPECEDCMTRDALRELCARLTIDKEPADG